MNIGPATKALNPGSFFSRAFIPLESGAVEGFAQEIARRASQTALPEGAERTVDLGGLEKAVSGTVSYVEENFGDRAARTVMGIVLKRASSGALDEDSLGEGFVDALEFIDRTFGIASGDRAMEHFNGELNSAINGYFQNGQDESFLTQDLGSATQKLGQAAGQAIAAVMKKFTENAVDPDSMLMGSAQDDFEKSLDEARDGSGTLADEMAPAVDESGFPVDPEADGQAAGGGASTEAREAVQAALAEPSHGAKRRGRSIRRRRAGSANAYDASGLTPGVVVNKQV